MLKKIFFLTIICIFSVAHAHTQSLLQAAREGDIKHIEQALATNPDATEKDPNGNSVIFFLAQHAQAVDKTLLRSNELRRAPDEQADAKHAKKEQFLDFIRQVAQLPGAPVKDLAQFKDSEIRTLFNEELNWGN